MGAVKYEKRYDEDSEKRMVYELRANGEPNMHIGIFESEENALKYARELEEQEFYKSYLFEVYHRPYFKDIYFKD
ncbi:DUF3110 domain-containing protein [Enterococcus hirae]|uniref:DUF3110 domain-containing protein n=1 Tax=Enterococcus hirae TaxID=1354 RepID=UPI002EA94BF0|nr:DUF3110 domain-containing protein [Enterococcus hirae]EMF0424447.1 DUF3110 domain-containing protein [Enterococcus hirae]